MELSRRQFIGGAAAVAGAAALPSLMSAAPAVATPTLALPIAAAPWVPLDPTKAARTAWEIYKGFHAPQSACCEASYWSVVGQLAASFPATWGLIPKGLFNYGGGGVNAYGSICGIPNGGTAALTQLGAPTNVKNALMRWYETTALPSNACYTDYKSGNWIPGGTSGGVWGGATGLTIPHDNVPRSRSNSIICHVSLTKWRAAADKYILANPDATGGASDRCGKLCYDLGYFLATLINRWKAGATIDGAVAPSASATGCKASACHGSVPTDPLCDAVTAQGQMDCKPCHTGL